MDEQTIRRSRGGWLDIPAPRGHRGRSDKTPRRSNKPTRANATRKLRQSEPPDRAWTPTGPLGQGWGGLLGRVSVVARRGHQRATAGDYGAPGDPSGATRATHDHEESVRRLPSVRILEFFDGWPQRVPKEPSVKKFPESDRREPPTRIFLSFQRRYQINAGSVFKLRTAIVKDRAKP